MNTDRFLSRPVLAGAAIVLLAAGGAAGAAAYAITHRPAPDWNNVPRSQIAKLQDDSMIEVEGHVAERFGNRFVLADATGRALIDTGPAENASVGLNEKLRVRGRFDDGAIHAGEIVHASGKIDLLRPARRPPRDRFANCTQQQQPDSGGPAGPRG